MIDIRVTPELIVDLDWMMKTVPIDEGREQDFVLGRTDVQVNRHITCQAMFAQHYILESQATSDIDGEFQDLR